jgi:hypothetical protein
MGFQPPSAGGTWSGTFTSNGSAGNTIQVSAQLTEASTSSSAQFVLTGPGTITGLGACGPSGTSNFTFQGQHTGSSVVLAATGGGQTWLQLSGMVTPDGSAIGGNYTLTNTSSVCTSSALGVTPTGVGGLVNNSGATQTLNSNLEDLFWGSFTINIFNYYPACSPDATSCPTSSIGYFGVYAVPAGTSSQPLGSGGIPAGQLISAGGCYLEAYPTEPSLCDPIEPYSEQIMVPAMTAWITIRASITEDFQSGMLYGYPPCAWIPQLFAEGQTDDMICNDTSVTAECGAYAPSQLSGPYVSAECTMPAWGWGGQTVNVAVDFTCNNSNATDQLCDVPTDTVYPGYPAVPPQQRSRILQSQSNFNHLLPPL